jgi:glucuronoarabinoxylan endo-1,4-beta-xylanase
MRAAPTFAVAAVAATLAGCTSAGSGSSDASTNGDSGAAEDASTPGSDASFGADVSLGQDSSSRPDSSNPESDATPAPDGAPEGGLDSSSEGGTVGTKDAGTPAPTDVVVETSALVRRIDGFGASDAWSGTPFTMAQADLFFDPVKGIGLSLLRVGISPTGGYMGAGEGANAVLAAARGAAVWGTPWSPPLADTTGANSAGYAGNINPADYDAWAAALASFATTMKNDGVPLYGISAQNEPDFPASSYASCTYTAAQMVAFIKVLGPKLALLDPRPKLLAPEPDIWSDFWGGTHDYAAAIRADATASSFVDVLATHDYDHQPLAIPTGTTVTQPIWETEVSGQSGTGNCDSVCVGPNVTIDNGILVAQWIYEALVVGGASAWHYWWFISAGDDNGGLLPNSLAMTKRLYTIGNFSKFVRPGYQLVSLGGSAVPSGVQAVAFVNPANGGVAIVAINANMTATPLSFYVSGTSWPANVTPWVTSATLDLASQAPLSVTSARFAATLAAQSVTTFVGAP